MLKKISHYFSYASFRGLNSTNNKRFIEWRQKQMYKQIAFISSVTGVLYIFLSFINRFTAPEASAFYIANIQLFLISPYVFFVSYLAYKRKKYFYIELSLFIAPLYAAIFHVLIISKFENFSTYQVELYLMIFWIFAISGLRLFHATIASLIIFSIGTLSALFLYPNELTPFIMHLSWMFVSLIFGFSGGYLLEESQRSTFFKQKELEELALKDKLTGLYNRQKLEVMIEKELHKATRYQHIFGVIIFDIDFFKSVNDSHGHQVGDTVLINISDKISKNIRPTDTLFRWGGEEFIIIALDVNKESLITMAELLRKKIESMQHEKLEQLTISLGVTLSLENDSVESLIRRADKALYNAKNSGRNRVEFL